MGDFSPVSYKACVVWGKGLNTTASRTRLFVPKFKRYTCIQAARNTKTLYIRVRGIVTCALILKKNLHICTVMRWRENNSIDRLLL